MDKEIKIQRKWLERLIEVAELAEKENKNIPDVGFVNRQWFWHLMGFIQSSKDMLD